MRLKKHFSAGKLAIAVAAIAAISTSSWIIVRESTSCVSINGHFAAVFISGRKSLAALNRFNSSVGRLPESESILICSADNGEVRLTLSKLGEVFCGLFSVEGNPELISLSNSPPLDPQQLTLNWWDATTGRLNRTATLTREFPLFADLRFVLSPRGDRFYLIQYVSRDLRNHMPPETRVATSIRCWELPSAEKQFAIEDESLQSLPLESIVFSADGSLIAAAFEPGFVKIWDAITGKQLHEISNAAARQVAFSADNHLLTAGTGETVQIWNLQTGEPSSQFVVGKLGQMVLSPDQKRLAISDSKRFVEIWDIRRGQRLRRFDLGENIDSGIADVKFSLDGTRLAAIGRELSGTTFEWRNYDAHLDVWDVDSGQLIHHSSFERGRGSHQLIFDASGTRLMVASEQCVTLCHLAADSP